MTAVALSSTPERSPRRRRLMALIGPSVNIGARLLKHGPPGAIIAIGEVVEALRQHAPRLADEFHPLDTAFAVPGAEGMTVATYVVPAVPAAVGAAEPVRCSPDVLR